MAYYVYRMLWCRNDIFLGEHAASGGTHGIVPSDDSEEESMEDASEVYFVRDTRDGIFAYICALC